MKWLFLWVINMIKNVEIIVALLAAFLGLIMFFDSRIFIKKHLKSSNENKAVRVFKVLGGIIFILCTWLVYIIGSKI